MNAEWLLWVWTWKGSVWFRSFNCTAVLRISNFNSDKNISSAQKSKESLLYLDGIRYLNVPLIEIRDLNRRYKYQKIQNISLYQSAEATKTAKSATVFRYWPWERKSLTLWGVVGYITSHVILINISANNFFIILCDNLDGRSYKTDFPYLGKRQFEFSGANSTLHNYFSLKGFIKGAIFSSGHNVASGYSVSKYYTDSVTEYSVSNTACSLN